MTLQEILKIIDEINAKNLLILCHHNADPDAVCSAYALSSLIKKFRSGVNIKIGAAQGISRLSKHIIGKLSMIAIDDHPQIEKADIILLLDTNTISQLNDLAEKVKLSKAPIVVIDHHAIHPETEKLARICISDETASSTCEIVYQLYKTAGVEVTGDEAKALFLGIAFDTRHFVLASSSTIKILAELVDAGVNAQELLPLLSLPMDFSEKVARLKACRRSKMFRINDWIVVVSHVSAFQASAARALIDLGADVAAVAGQRNDNLEVSIRCTRDFHEKTGIHLGRDIAKPLGEFLKGMGGGHATAAGVNGFGEIEAGLKRFLKLLREKLAQQTKM